ASYTHTTISAGDIIYKEDVSELRDGLHYALTALGIVTSSYTDSTLAGAPSGTTIKAVHIRELRTRSTSGAGNSTSGGSSGGLHYVLSDLQGSARAVMNNASSSSTIVARHDYLPFGEEIGSGIGSRTLAQGYNASDGNRWKYGMTERDATSGLDHTPWRKYESMSGRWTSPDPISGGIADPQSFNRYAYTTNDPVNKVDLTGLDADLEAGLSVARNALQYASCRSLFGNTNPLATLNSMAAAGTLSIMSQYPVPNKKTIVEMKDFNPGEGAVTVYGMAPGRLFILGNTLRSQAAGPTIVINEHGFYMNGRTGSGIDVTTVRDGGFFGMTLAETRGAVILHELGHALSNRFLPDGNDPNKSKQNSRMVQLFCFDIPKMMRRDAPIPLSPLNIITTLPGNNPRGSPTLQGSRDAFDGFRGMDLWYDREKRAG
ncbi:MAG TPA: hypothetical protein DC054_19400, partial [Blastocatellia bacterium]|nr:hypothetical protein [Blastocatellia bacterium]